jgi:hypothetical protein
VGISIYFTVIIYLIFRLVSVGSALAFVISKFTIGPILIESCVSKSSLKTFKKAIDGTTYLI